MNRKYWDRKCPDCSTIFRSVQSKGICPNCECVFWVDEVGKVYGYRGKRGDRPRKVARTEKEIKHLHLLLWHLSQGSCTAEQFFEILLMYWLFLPPECWNSCAAELADELSQSFFDFLEKHLIPKNFRPSTIGLWANGDETDDVERKELELEPIYREIHRYWKARVGLITASQ